MNLFQSFLRDLELKLLILRRYRNKFETANKRIEGYLKDRPAGSVNRGR